MKIFAINNYYNTNNVRSGEGAQPASLIRFTGIKNVSLPAGDTFSRSIDPKFSYETFLSHLQTIEEKIKAQIHPFTPENLDNAIKNTLAKFPDIKEREVLQVMQRLTQWADYSCLKSLSKGLSSLHIGSLTGADPLNSIFNYFITSKNLFHLKPSDKVNLGVLVSSRNLHTVEATTHFKTTFINLEGFDEGINLFNDSNMLETVTQSTLSRVKSYRKQNPGVSFNEALNQVLNGEITKFLSDKGLNVQTLRRHGFATRKTILKQMQPIIPNSIDEIKKSIESVAKFFTNNDEEYNILRNKTAEYFANQLNIFSKQRLVDELGLINEEISKYLKKHRLPKKNTYLLIPSDNKTTKSYSIITEMFARRNNIPPEKILNMDDVTELKNFPENSTFVILDDVAGTGSSLCAAAKYNQSAHTLPPDKHILFCPVIAQHSGLEAIEDCIDSSWRSKLDQVIMLEKNIIKDLCDEQVGKQDYYFLTNPIGEKALGFSGLSGIYTQPVLLPECIVFPYMAPDNNSDLSAFILKYFLPNSNPIKSLHTNFFDIENILKFVKKGSKD